MPRPRKTREAYDPRVVAAEALEERRASAAARRGASAKVKATAKAPSAAVSKPVSVPVREPLSVPLTADLLQKRGKATYLDMVLLHHSVLQAFLAYMQQTKVADLSPSMMAVIVQFLRHNGISRDAIERSRRDHGSEGLVALLKKAPSFDDWDVQEKARRDAASAEALARNLPPDFGMSLPTAFMEDEPWQ